MFVVQVLDTEHIRTMVEEDSELRRAIKAEARKNFAMNAARRPRNLMGLKDDEDGKNIIDSAKIARDLRKKYGGGVVTTNDDGKRTKKGVPVGLLAEMQVLFDRDQRGLKGDVRGNAESGAHRRSSAADSSANTSPTGSANERVTSRKIAPS